MPNLFNFGGGYNTLEEKMNNYFNLGKNATQNEFGMIEVASGDLNDIKYTGFYKVEQNVVNNPFETQATLRVEVTDNNNLTQWISQFNTCNTYKRVCNNGVWEDWLFVEGELSLWVGNLELNQSIIIPNLSRYRKLKVYITSTGYVTCQRDGTSYNGCTYWNNNGKYYVSTAELKFNENTLTNNGCGYLAFTQIPTHSNQFSQSVVRIYAIG